MGVTFEFCGPRTLALATLLVLAACGSDDQATGDSPANAAGTTGGAVPSAGVSAAAGMLGSATGGTGNIAGTAAPTGGSMGAGTGGATGGTGVPMTGGVGGAGGTGGAGGMVAPMPGEFTVSAQLASDVDPSAIGTVGIVTFSTTVDPIAEAHIEFGPDETYGMEAPVDLAEPEHRTLLLGMKPESTYHLRVVVSDGSTSYTSDDHTLDTGPSTNSVLLGNFNVLDEAAREPGFIVASYWSGSSTAFILDSDGDIVWWHDFGAGGIARARMSADGKNMWMILADNSGGPLRRVTMDTLEEQAYMSTSGSHDLTPVSGATMAYIDYGEPDCDSIFEIDPSGMTVEVFESNDVLQGGGGGFGGGGFGGCHGNALRYSQAEDVYTFSDVAQDVLVVDRQGQLQWRVSEILSGGIAAYGGRQHGHHLLSDSIVIFANSGGGGMSSTVVEYTHDGQEIWSHGSGEFSANLGDVQRLPGGNTLITYSNASLVHEVDPEGNVVMEFDGAGSRIGYTLWRESLYGLPPDLTD